MNIDETETIAKMQRKNANADMLLRINTCMCNITLNYAVPYCNA